MYNFQKSQAILKNKYSKTFYKIGIFTFAHNHRSWVLSFGNLNKTVLEERELTETN